ncbi:MAG: transglutaminase domain-containing protein [Acidobacteriota bacterium]
MTPRNSIWWKLPGVVIWMSAVGLLAAGYTAPAGLLFALLGVVTAFVLAGALEALPLRLGRLWLAAAGVMGLTVTLSAFLRGNSTVVGLLGSESVYAITEAENWFVGVVCWLTPVLLSARRFSLFLTVEAASLVGIFSSVLAAHRDGSIHRPFFVTDWLLERNYDPMPFFLGAGALLGILLVVWMLSRSSAKRTLLDPVLLIAMIVALFLFLPDGKLRQLSAFAGGAGGSEKDKKERPHHGGQGGKGEQQQDQNQNQDPNPSGGEGRKSFPVAVVSLHDDYQPPYGTFYFRQDTLSNYNGRRLVRDASGKLDTDVGMPFPAEPIEVPLRDRADTAPGGRERIAHRLRTTVALMTPHSKPFGLIDVSKLEPAPNPDAKRFERAYKVESSVLDADVGTLLNPSLGSEKLSPEVWQHNTEVPEDARYRQIAEQAKQLLPAHLRGIPIAQALAIKFWMDKNTTYNLNVPQVDEDADPVASFLFGDRNGYCVHLAHSAVYLFRTMGVPSRVSIGYAVGARQRGDGSTILIRNGDAHAWPEVYVRGLGWVVLDITPEKVITPPQEEKVDQDLQRMLGEMARQTPGSPKEENPPAGDGDLRKALLEAMQGLSKAMVPVLLFTLGALYLMKFWRRCEPRFCSPARLPVASYRAALDSLADLGLYRERGTSREAFARRVAERVPAMTDLTELHMRAALGPAVPRLGREQYLALSAAVARQAGHGMQWWRRLLGLLHPLSWWKVS